MIFFLKTLLLCSIPSCYSRFFFIAFYRNYILNQEPSDSPDGFLGRKGLISKVVLWKENHVKCLKTWAGVLAMLVTNPLLIPWAMLGIITILTVGFY